MGKDDGLRKLLAEVEKVEGKIRKARFDLCSANAAFGKEVRRRRKSVGMTLREVGDACDVGLTTIYVVENGFNVTPGLRKRIVRAIGREPKKNGLKSIRESK